MFKFILIGCLVCWIGQTSVLSSADCVSGFENTWMYANINPVGLSMDISELISQVDSMLFQNYLSNSRVYGDWYSIFALDFHNYGGYKYNCSLAAQIANRTVSCDYDLANDTTLLKRLGSFVWNVTMTFGFTIGWDYQGADFSNDVYMKNSFVKFISGLRSMARQSFLTASADRANEWNASGLAPGYDYLQPAQDCSYLNQYLYYYWTAPGVTEAASSSWYTQISDIAYQCGMFSVSGVVFKNPADLTIQNLLSEKYTTEYIKRRFTVDGISFLSQLQWNMVILSDLKLVEDPMGVNGLTNSFAAAIWATEFIMEWIIAGGFRVHFYNPITNASYQSVLGQLPTFAPSALYYGLLTGILANYYEPYIVRPAVVSGTSSKIKIYGLENFFQYSVLILNKDTNINASGTVDLKLSIATGIKCMYISASNLSDTTNINFAGLKFGSNNSFPTGTYSEKLITVGANGLYSVPLNYSQMAYCKTIRARTYRFFPKGSSSYGEWLRYVLLSLLLFLFWL